MSVILLLLLIGFSLYSHCLAAVVGKRQLLLWCLLVFGEWLYSSYIITVSLLCRQTPCTILNPPPFYEIDCAIKNLIFTVCCSCHFCNVDVSSVFGLVLILVDIILVIVDLSLSPESRKSVGTTLEAISLVISFFFLIDVLLRIYVEGLVCDSKLGKYLSFT